MDRLGLAAEVGQGPVPGHYRVTRRLDPALRVSVVIPTIGQSDLIWGSRRVMVVEAVRSLLDRTAHDNLEIVVVYDDPTPPEVLAELREVAGDKLALERFTRPFNYSEKMNVGCLRASGDRLVFLNDDVEVISQGGSSSSSRRSTSRTSDSPAPGSTSATPPSSTPGTPTPAATTCTPTGTCRATPTGRSAPSSSTARPAA